jgi:hypothetical protein
MARRIAKAGAMSRVRKEARIIDLYENYGYTVKEICSEERVSTTTVSDIIKKLKQSKEPVLISARAKAFELFRQGNSLLDVAIKLDLSYEDMMTYFLEFLKLNNSTQLLTLLVTTEGQVNEFLSFFQSCTRLNITPGFVKETLPLIEQAHNIRNQISALTLELDNGRKSVTNMREELRKLKSERAQLESDRVLKDLKLQNLVNSILELEQVEKAYKDTEFYQTVRKVATEVATQILQNRNIDRIEARVAISKVIRENPELLAIISPPTENYYDAKMEAKFSYLLDQSLKEGHKEFLIVAMSSIVSRLCEGIDEYRRTKNIPRRSNKLIEVGIDDIPNASQ